MSDDETNCRSNPHLKITNLPTDSEKLSVWYFWKERQALERMTDWADAGFRAKFPRVEAAWEAWNEAAKEVDRAVEAECHVVEDDV